MLRSVPDPWNAGCCTREIAVPWKDCFEVVELGLWSMLSTPAVVKTASHLGRANYLLLVVEVAGTIPQLCAEGQSSVIGNRNPHVCQLVD